MNESGAAKDNRNGIVKQESIECDLKDHQQQDPSKETDTETNRHQIKSSPIQDREELIDEKKKNGSGSEDSRSRLSHRLTHTLKGHSQSISSICFSPDGNKLSSSSSDGIILIWNIILQNSDLNNPNQNNKDIRHATSNRSIPSSSSSIPQVEFFKKLMIVQVNPTQHGGVEEDEEVGSLVRTNNHQSSAKSTKDRYHNSISRGINDLTWSPDSRFLIGGSDDHSIYIWSIDRSTSSIRCNNSQNNGKEDHKQGRPVRSLKGHSHCVYCVRFNPIGSLLISGSLDESIKVWDFLTGKLLRTLPGHSEVVSSLDFSRDGSIIISASFDGLIRMWDTTSGQCLKTLVVAQETNAPVTFIALTPNSRYLITCSLDSTVRIWDYRTKEGTVVKSYSGHSNTKYSIPARVISLKNQKIDTIDHDHNGSRNNHNFLERDQQQDFVLMGSEDGQLWIWDLQSRDPILKIISHQDSMIGLAIHPFNSHIIVTAGIDKNPFIKIFNLSIL